jgi:hypothetical protein
MSCPIQVDKNPYLPETMQRSSQSIHYSLPVGFGTPLKLVARLGSHLSSYGNYLFADLSGIFWVLGFGLFI